MKVTRIDAAVAYEAPRHFGMQGYKVQGGDISPFPAQVGVSIFNPGGGAELAASSVDRVYVVAAGRIVVITGEQDHAMVTCDSCFIPAGEARAIRNDGVLPAVLITVIPTA